MAGEPKMEFLVLLAHLIVYFQQEIRYVGQEGLGFDLVEQVCSVEKLLTKLFCRKNGKRTSWFAHFAVFMPHFDEFIFFHCLIWTAEHATKR